MDRVLKELDHLRNASDKDAVHDLRVAIRRCRSVAAVMQEVDPDPAWEEMRSVPKKLFRKLGELRDTQVMDKWITEHGAENDKIRRRLHEFFAKREPELLDQALRIANKFDEKTWKRLDRKLRKRARLVPTGSLAAECLAVERFEEAKELHGKALRAQRPESWHALRIGIKKLRYTAESLLPEKYELWSENLKRLQDLLGQVHDLDVLSGIVKERASGESDESQQEWQRMIDRERDACLSDYRELAVGKNSVWNEWRHALPQGKRLQSAALARIRVTARATDAHPRRAAHVSRLAVAVFDALKAVQAAPAFGEHNMRRVLRSAARMCGINLKRGNNPSRKAARRYLLNLPAPPSWTPEDWELLAWTVQYHRGAEPKTTESAFSRLSQTLQQNIRALAGVIRLARGLRKCGVETCTGLLAEKLPDTITMQVPGLTDTEQTAARLAAAKHLLEAYLATPLILKAEPRAETLFILPGQSDRHVRLSVASD
jgi:CHAD domain-containing protein